MSKRFYACVYGGASEHIDDVLKEDVKHLGKIIADERYSLVYGAGATGCMGAVARGVSENGGYVMGISPYFIRSFEEIFACDNTVMVDTMSERKTLMEKHADVFFIAPGGIGTMDEFFQVLTLKYLERLSAPIVVLNLNGFYDSLIKLIDDIVGLGAAKESLYDLFDVVTSVEDEKLIKILRDIKKAGLR
ncbi:MAG: TIGR00730 family Rossman fold protein [Clostridia bacterium]|nr:TIGR00730 family Rossman fold protein [Clostridia bacterium]